MPLRVREKIQAMLRTGCRKLRPDDQRFSLSRAGSWWGLSLALVVVFFSVLTYDLWALRCLFRWDAWDAEWPWFSYLATSLGQGRFPHWDPHSSCGFPFYANPQAAAFYPVYLLVGWALGGGYKVFQYLWLAHWLVAVPGCFWLAKRIGLSPLGSAVTSITFAASGFFLGNAEHTVFVNAVAFFPLTLLAIDKACEDDLRWAFVAGALYGLAGLSGSPNIQIYMGIMCVVWCLARYGFTARSMKASGIFLVVSAIVVSPLYIAFLHEVGGETHRSWGLPVQMACNSERFPLSALVSLVTPGFTVAYRSFIDCDTSMSNGYLGIWGLAAVLVMFTVRSMRKEWRWLLLFMSIAFLMSLGTEGGLRIIGYYVFPPLRFMRHSSTFRVFWIFGGAIAAGVVFDRLLSGPAWERTKIVHVLWRILPALLFIGVAVCLWALVVPPSTSPAEVLQYLAWPLVVVTALIASICLYTMKKIRLATLAAAIIGIVILDMLGHFQTNSETVGTINRARIEKFHLMEEARKGIADKSFTGTERRPLVPDVNPNQGHLDGRLYVASYYPAPSKHYDALLGGHCDPHLAVTPTHFAEYLASGPRFWLTRHVGYAAEDDERALSRLQQSGPGSPMPVVVHSSTEGATPDETRFIVPGSYGTVRVVKYAPEEITLLIESPEDAWLFCSERYAPSWRARVDGAEAPLYKANWCFRLVRVPAGSHTVRMTYSPWIHKPLWVASWGVLFLAMFFAGGLTIQGYFRRGGQSGNSLWTQQTVGPASTARSTAQDRGTD